MNIQRTISRSTCALFAVAVLLPVGCDSAELAGDDRLAESAALLELSPNQDFVEGPETLAFEVIDSEDGTESLDFEMEADPDAATGCTLLRPLGWSGSGVHCAEFCLPAGSPPQLKSMSNGQIHYGSSRCGGVGNIRVQCVNGGIQTLSSSCGGGGGGGGGLPF